MQTKVAKWGNSLGVRIPQWVAEKAEINDGTIVEVSFKDDAIIIIKKNRLSLEEMLNDITAENLHDELDTGSVTINGGWVKATGGGGGAGIGGGPSTYTTGSGGAVTINGGTVFAIGSSNYWGTGSGIGGGYGASASGGYIGAAGTVTITGGSVYASSIQAAVKNSDGNGVIQAPVSGLPANTGISYTDNGGNPISCATDPQGKIYLWLIPGTHVIGISAGAIQYSIVGILPDTANYFEILPDDANLTMVCNQVISTTGGLGTSADPYSASIIVPNSQATVSLTDLMPHNTYAAAALYADGDFATTTGSVELVPGAETTIYICVTSQEGTHQLYYELNVLRLSADAVLSKACNQAISTTGGSGTSVDPYLASISVPYTQVAVTVADLTPRSTYATTNLYTNSSFITATGIFNLEPGAATDVYIGVTSQDETATLYYRVSVTRRLSDDAILSRVCDQEISTTSGSGTIINPFVASISVPNSQATVSTADLTPRSAYAAAELYTDGSFTTTTGSAGIEPGATILLYIGVTAHDGTRLYYELNVTRSSSDASLTRIGNQVVGTTGGSGTIADPYLALFSMPYSQAAVTVADLTLGNPYATATLYTNSSFTTATDSVSLTADAYTTVYIGITSQDGTARLYYTVSILRLSDNALLSKLSDQVITIAGGTGTLLDPYLSSVYVPNSQTTVTTPDLATENDYATAVMYTDSSFTTTTGIFNLEPGTATDVYIGITSRDETATLYYRVSVTRRLSDDAILSRVCDQEISTTSGSGTRVNPYVASISVPNSQATVSTADLTPRSAHAVAEIYVDDSFNTTTGSAGIEPGATITLYIRVTAHDGTSLYYKLNVTRSSSDASLTMIGNQMIGTTGGSGTIADPYLASISVPYAQAALTVADLTPGNPYATATLYTNSSFTTTTGSVSLTAYAYTTVYIGVTSQDGTARLYYTVSILRLSNNALLSKLSDQVITIAGGTGTLLDPYLSSVYVPDSQTTITTPDLATENAYSTAVIYTDSSFTTATGIFNLEPGTATDVNIGITSQDETATLYYRVSVTPMSSYILDISAGNITAAAGTKLGTFKLVCGNPQVTLDSIPLSMPITIMDSTAGIAPTANTVTIDVNSAMSIILDGVNMNNSASPFVIVSGSTVNLTLQGTNTLTCSDRGAGLQVNDNAVLNITADSTGSLLANGGILTLGSGIGSSDTFDNTGTVTISGGTVTATGGDMGAGIGGAGLGSGGTVTIMGGTVTATGGALFGPGIGGWNDATVIISGGMVTATGTASPDIGGFPGIGGFNRSRVEINGGTVIATSADSAGIGGDSNPYYTGGTVTINGGKVTATSGFVGIGGANILVTVNGGTVTAIGSTNDLGGSKVIINGGSVNARAQSLVYNSSNDPEYLVTVTGLPQNYALSYSVEGGNTVSCSTDASGKLYLWLPASGNATAIEFAGADGGTYSVSGTVQGAGSDSGGTWAVGSVEPIDECFIATAAFGSKFEPSVALLRDFRDKYLLTNTLGKSLVNFYYQNSPPLAAMIAASEPLKIAARVMLAPVIAIVYLIYHPILLVAVLALLIAFLVYRFKLRKRYSWNCPI
jgi:antitoxin component of MazEF toxin-antitoxin module/histidinol phosphatase-like enzyme